MSNVIKFPQFEACDFAPGETEIVVDVVNMAIHLRDSGKASPDGMTMARMLTGYIAANREQIDEEDYAVLVAIGSELLRTDAMFAAFGK